MVETKPTLSKQNKIILFLMALIFAIFFIANPLNIIVKAESNRVTSVIEDLQTDPNFSVENYPSITPTKPEDYTLKVIQIAESTAKELFIYVYQSTAVTKEIHATSINISTSIGENFAPKNYDLTFLNARGVFQKYVVNDFYVKNDALRYYDIVSIFRAFDEDLDNKPEADQTISERSYKVGQLWTACTINSEVSYSYETEETIEITDKFVGLVRYATQTDDGWFSDLITGGNKACDRHFVAFSTDKKIDELVEAELTYQKQTASFVFANKNGTGPAVANYGEIEKANSYLTITDEKKVEAKILTGFKTNTFSYNWKSIQNTNDFVNSVNTENIFVDAIFNTQIKSKITQDGLNNLKGKQWVLTFDNTDYSFYSDGLYYSEEKYTITSNVTILRLKFISGGKPYNLGVVDNKQTGSGKPINDTTIEKDWGWLMKVIIKTLKIIFYTIIALVLIWVIKLVWNLIKAIFTRRR